MYRYSPYLNKAAPRRANVRGHGTGEHDSHAVEAYRATHRTGAMTDLQIILIALCGIAAAVNAATYAATGAPVTLGVAVLCSIEAIVLAVVTA
jgi:hypothetical protein